MTKWITYGVIINCGWIKRAVKSERSSHHGVSVGSCHASLEFQYPGEYQARMADKVLEGFYLNGTVVYIDDTVVYGKDKKTFLQMLDMVLDRMV